MTHTSLLRTPLFVKFLLGQISSQLAIQMLLVGLGWQVYLITESAMALGWVGLARYLPQLILTLHAGSVADRFNRVKIIMWGRGITIIAMLMLSYTSYTNSINEYVIYLACVLLGIAQTYNMPASQAIVPNLVSRANHAQAQTITASGREATTIIGPALGGVIYIFGSETLYFLCSLVSLLSVLTFAGLIESQPERLQSNAKKNALFDGFRFVWRNQLIFGSLLLDTLAVLIGSVTALLPMIARDILETDSVGLGLLRSAPAVGAVLMSLLIARYPIKRNSGRILYYAVGVFGLATIVFGFSDQLWLSLAMLFLLGSADMVSVIIRATWVQDETPDEMRGRVSAVNALFISTSNELGEFESGLAAAWIGAVPSILLGGVGTLLMVAIWIPLFPSLWNRDHLVNPETEESR